MPILNKRKNGNEANMTSSPGTTDRSTKSMSSLHREQQRGTGSRSVCFLSVLTLIFGGGTVLLTAWYQQSLTTSLRLIGNSKEGTVVESDGSIRVTFDQSSSAELRVKSDQKNKSLHSATLSFSPRDCPQPQLYLRLEGDALLPVILEERSRSTNSIQTWESGDFSVPISMAGSYDLIAYWYGCKSADFLKMVPKTIPVARWSNENGTGLTSRKNEATSSSVVFPESVWMKAKLFNKSSKIQAKEYNQSYVFHNPQINPSNVVLVVTPDNRVASQEGATFEETQFYDFRSLSNYELVCWIGDTAASESHEAFQALRSVMFGPQRPFKFHIYPSTSMQQPDTDWTQETKERFRKCKHILISYDSLLERVSQKEYLELVKTFIFHLLRAFPDDTFPIWILSVTETLQSRAKIDDFCHTPTLPQSTVHPCNVALRTLFAASPFPSRVQFLDTVDLAMPRLTDTVSPSTARSIHTAIAMRLFVIVGKRVQAWRAAKQIGIMKGLTRGDKTEPNFDLVPYTGWS